MGTDPRIGTRLGHYLIEGVLGRGGMGVVYLVEHVRLKKKMALKVLPPELADDEDFRRRFERESQLAASLDHPNIVQVHDAGEVEGLLYIAMRYVEGTDLARVIRGEGALVPARALSIVSQAADALDEAHAQGLVHRDVKPANILLAPSRRGGDHVYLSDFGLARRWASASRLTRTGFFVGTIHYSAPEQFSDQEIDGRTDVYSLGCVLYECLTGRVPFDRSHEPAVMYAHLRDPPPAVSAVRPDLPAGFDEVVAVAMAKSKEERYATCGSLAEGGRSALEGLPLPAPAVETRQAAVPPEPLGTTPSRTVEAGSTRRPPLAGGPTRPVAPDRAVTERTGPPPRRRKGPWAAVIGMLVAGLAVGGFFAYRGLAGEERREPTANGTTTQSPEAPAELLRPASIVASSTSDAGRDACGQEVPFNAERMIDGVPTTAWRTPGDGVGESIEMVFDGLVRVRRIGLIPGYAKTDPCDGTDRFTENRVIRKVRYVFGDGSEQVQRFQRSRELQFIDVDVVTDRIRIAIERTSPPGRRDFASISEIEVYGDPSP